MPPSRYLARPCCPSRSQYSSHNPYSKRRCSHCLLSGGCPDWPCNTLLELLQYLIAAVADGGAETRLANLRLDLLDRHARADVSSGGADHVLLHHRAAEV